ncbi:hypothetical protein HYH03_010552 [Edaphochlamys debaryana]|uniref:Cyclin-like domain-containing protein n=1 Tax=Edaphochlamys debaryana TaxID=47281 RepID=A0A835XY06_9CHLO|nr:hypothetical protein HYH03_010552 [Edaphochlamys debaryana]|eukprot:KAG2491108.1 hypothetical protein HYH03_010552 [Edaphochlamys debaryana]
MAFQSYAQQPGDPYMMDGYAQGHHGDMGHTSPAQQAAAQAAHLSQQMAHLREEEHQQDLASEKKHKKSRFIYRTLEDLRTNNPSVKDGLDPDKERLWRRQYCKLIQDAGQVLKIPQWGIAVGITLCHRFFAVKSMKRNDRFVVATACLFLAAKIEESPRQLRQVIVEVERVRHSKNPAALRALDDPAHMERVKEEVLQAERAVLYTLGFDLQIPHPYQPLIDWLKEHRLLADVPNESPFRQLPQNSWNLVNDSLRTTLCLQFPAPHIAHAALYLADLLNVDEQGVHHGKLPRGAAFYDKYDIRPDDLACICGQILGEYEQSKLGQMAMAAGGALPAAVAAARAAAEARVGPSGLGGALRAAGARPGPDGFKQEMVAAAGAAGVALGGAGPGAAAAGVKAEEEEGEVKE